MKKTQNCMLTLLTLLALLVLGITVRSQDAASRDTSRAAGPAVTIPL